MIATRSIRKSVFNSNLAPPRAQTSNSEMMPCRGAELIDASAPSALLHYATAIADVHERRCRGDEWLLYGGYAGPNPCLCRWH